MDLPPGFFSRGKIENNKKDFETEELNNITIGINFIFVIIYNE
jgi:hypothetical protein